MRKEVKKLKKKIPEKEDEYSTKMEAYSSKADEFTDDPFGENTPDAEPEPAPVIEEPDPAIEDTKN
jgi:hypothetical protein